MSQTGNHAELQNGKKIVSQIAFGTVYRVENWPRF